MPISTNKSALIFSFTLSHKKNCKLKRVLLAVNRLSFTLDLHKKTLAKYLGEMSRIYMLKYTSGLTPRQTTCTKYLHPFLGHCLTFTAYFHYMYVLKSTQSYN